MATEHNASSVFNPAVNDVVSEVMAATGGEGADCVFECAGVQPAVDLALKAVRPRGSITYIALWSKHATIHINHILLKEVTITGWSSNKPMIAC
jgi:threonine dehydrogenase-like Zn-dependent dehydrogenase